MRIRAIQMYIYLLTLLTIATDRVMSVQLITEETLINAVTAVQGRDGVAQGTYHRCDDVRYSHSAPAGLSLQ